MNKKHRSGYKQEQSSCNYLKGVNTLTVKELKAIKKQIKDLQKRVDHDDSTDELQGELQALIATWESAIERLSPDVLVENEIYLHCVLGYKWKRIADLYGTGVKPDAVRARCHRYIW